MPRHKYRKFYRAVRVCRTIPNDWRNWATGFLCSCYGTSSNRRCFRLDTHPRKTSHNHYFLRLLIFLIYIYFLYLIDAQFYIVFYVKYRGMSSIGVEISPIYIF